MTDLDPDDPLDELASAHLDGLTSPDEAAAVAARPRAPGAGRAAPRRCGTRSGPAATRSTPSVVSAPSRRRSPRLDEAGTARRRARWPRPAARRARTRRRRRSPRRPRSAVRRRPRPACWPRRRRRRRRTSLAPPDARGRDERRQRPPRQPRAQRADAAAATGGGRRRPRRAAGRSADARRDLGTLRRPRRELADAGASGARAAAAPPVDDVPAHADACRAPSRPASPAATEPPSAGRRRRARRDGRARRPTGGGRGRRRARPGRQPIADGTPRSTAAGGDAPCSSRGHLSRAAQPAGRRRSAVRRNAATAASAAATHTRVFTGSSPSPESIHPAHTSPAKAQRRGRCRRRPLRERPDRDHHLADHQPEQRPGEERQRPGELVLPQDQRAERGDERAAQDSEDRSRPRPVTVPAPPTHRPDAPSSVSAMANGSHSPATSAGRARPGPSRPPTGPRRRPTPSSESSARSATRPPARPSPWPAASSTACSPLLVGTAVAVLLAISAVRVLDVYLPDAVVGEQHTWAAHLVVGGIFTLAGMVLWSRRRPRRRLSSGPEYAAPAGRSTSPHDPERHRHEPACRRPRRDHRRVRPGRAHGGRLHGPGQPRPPRDRGRAVVDLRPAGRPADADHRGRELPRLPRGDHGPRAHDPLPGAGRCGSGPTSAPRRSPGSTSPPGPSACGSATPRPPSPPTGPGRSSSPPAPSP